MPHYQRVQARDVYPGIDLQYYGNEGRQEHDFLVAAGTDPARIRLQLSGADKTLLTAAGDLSLGTSLGDVKLLKPVAYQLTDSGKTIVAARYTVAANHEVGFALGKYDRTRPLVIDLDQPGSRDWFNSGLACRYAVNRPGRCW